MRPSTSTSAALAIHPVTGNLWVASSQVSRLAEMTPGGVLLRELEVSGQGPASELSGLAFRDADTLLASSTRGVVYVLDLTPAAPGAPTLTAIAALAAAGTAANSAQASANVGQTIELVGTNFRAGELQVEFATRDAAGNPGVVLVSAVRGERRWHARAGAGGGPAATTGEVRVAGGTGSALLQIVPTIVGLSSGRPGEESSFDLVGSGFMEGASTITIGGIALADGYTNLADADVFGAQNSVYRAGGAAGGGRPDQSDHGGRLPPDRGPDVRHSGVRGAGGDPGEVRRRRARRWRAGLGQHRADDHAHRARASPAARWCSSRRRTMPG